MNKGPLSFSELNTNFCNLCQVQTFKAALAHTQNTQLRLSPQLLLWLSVSQRKQHHRPELLLHCRDDDRQSSLIIWQWMNIFKPPVFLLFCCYMDRIECFSLITRRMMTRWWTGSAIDRVKPIQKWSILAYLLIKLDLRYYIVKRRLVQGSRYWV